MEWTSETIARLYELHLRYVDTLRREIVDANRSLGSSAPEKCRLAPLSRAEFQALLICGSANDREATELWLRRMTRGNEREFPQFQAAG